MADEKRGHFDTTINTLKFLSEHQEEKRNCHNVV